MISPDLRRRLLPAALTTAALLSIGACQGLGDEAGLSGGEGGGSGAGEDGDATGVGTGTGGGARGVSGGGVTLGPAGELTGTSSSVSGATGSGGGSGTGGSGAGGQDGCEIVEDNLSQIATAVVDDSSSYAAPLIVRELVRDSGWDPTLPLPVRPHEFLNYYARPLDTEPLSAGNLALRAAALDVGSDTEGTKLVELGVTVSAEALPPVLPDVTFLIDTSPGTAGEPADRVEHVVMGAASRLTAEQQVAVLTWAIEDRVVRPMSPWSASDLDDITSRIGGLSPDFDFDLALSDALTIARQRADASGRPGVVIVVTDGRTGPSQATLEMVDAQRASPVPVRVVGVGVGPARSYSDAVLDELTDRSGGAYIYVPSVDEAESEVAAAFERLTQVAARDVALELRLPSAVEVVAATGGAGSAGSGIAAAGQNLAHDGTMTFHLLLRVQESIDVCQGIGLAVRYVDDAGALVIEPDGANGAVVGLGDLLAEGAWEMERISAIAAITAALRGPTAPRLGAASQTLSALLEVDREDPLKELCAALGVKCEGLADGGCQLACDPSQ